MVVIGLSELGEILALGLEVLGFYMNSLTKSLHCDFFKALIILVGSKPLFLSPGPYDFCSMINNTFVISH